MNDPGSSPAGLDRRPTLSPVAAVVVPVLHLVSAVFHVYCGAMNADEGFYAIAARSVMKGDLPYRDFGYTQMPLLPYVNGPLLTLTGYGLFEQRWVNGFWALLALILAARLVAARTTWLVALLVVASFSLAPGWMYNVHLGKTHAFTSLVVIIGTWIFVTQPGSGRKQAVLGLFGVVGVGCRLPAAPFFAVLWLAGFWHDGPVRRGRITMGILGLALPALALWGIFYAAAPEATRFWLGDFHLLSVTRRPWYASPADVFALAPPWWVAAAAFDLEDFEDM